MSASPPPERSSDTKEMGAVLPEAKLAKFELLLTEQIKTLNFLQEGLDQSLARLEKGMEIFQDRCDRRHGDIRNRVDKVEGWQDRCEGYRSGQDWRRQDFYIMGTLVLVFVTLVGFIFKGYL